MMKLDLDKLTVDSFNTSAADSPDYMYEQASKIHNTVLQHTQQISCRASDCGTCGGTDCWA